MQTRIESLIETLVDLAIGFCLAMILQALMWQQLGIAGNIAQNFWITVAMTGLSITRRYCTRRMFNWWKYQRTNMWRLD